LKIYNSYYLFFIFLVIFYGCVKVQPVSKPTETKIIKDTATVKAIPEKKISPEVKSEEKRVKNPKIRKDTVSIIGVGDIMLGTTYPANYLAPDDGKYLLQPLDSVLRNADVTFGNQEGALFDGTGIPKRCSDPSKCYAFKSPERYARYLAEAGFDIMSLANNHSGDFGPDAREATTKALKNAGILSSGSLNYPYTIFTKDSIRYGLASFSPNTGTCDINNIEEATRIVTELNAKCDIVIVSFHGGAEGRTHQHVTRKTEMFYGEDRGNVYQFAHKMIDAGADVIFGHGPHVTRAIDYYKDRFIVYSMGNFCTYGRFNLQGENGIAPLIKLYTDRQGRFLKGEITAISQTGEGGPVIDESKQAIFKIKELTLADFPEIGLIIHNNGSITKK
jgi:poly-gamma-glutamate capsule biosynthesis protein CapA/YwtB (metallophosphatase superfamily)